MEEFLLKQNLKNKMRFYYISANNSYPQNRHLIDGLRENGHKVFEYEERALGIDKYIKIVKNFWPQKCLYDVVIVGFTSPHFVPRKKLIRAWAGVDEKEFFIDKSIEKNKKFTVLFRGRFLPESGILTVVKTAKLLENEDIDFLLIGHGFLHREYRELIDKLKPKNFRLISKKISYKEL